MVVFSSICKHDNIFFEKKKARVVKNYFLLIKYVVFIVNSLLLSNLYKDLYNKILFLMYNVNLE